MSKGGSGEMTEFEILPGVPPYGAYREQFSTGSWGTHGEGFVVRVAPADAESWIGNFQRGAPGTTLSTPTQTFGI